MKTPLPCSTNWNFGLGQSKAHALMLWISLFPPKSIAWETPFLQSTIPFSKEHHYGEAAFPQEYVKQNCLENKSLSSHGVGRWDISQALLQAEVSSLQPLYVHVNRGKNTNQDDISKFNQDGISKFLLNLSQQREQETHPQPDFIPLRILPGTFTGGDVS